MLRVVSSVGKGRSYAAFAALSEANIFSSSAKRPRELTPRIPDASAPGAPFMGALGGEVETVEVRLLPSYPDPIYHRRFSHIVCDVAKHLIKPSRPSDNPFRFSWSHFVDKFAFVEIM